MSIAGMDQKPTKRGKITEVTREESARLRAIWDREQARLKASGLGTQEAFGAHFHIGNQAAVGFFLNGRTALSPKAAAAFARGLRCRVADFSPRLAAVLDAGAVAAWPFPDIDPERFARLSPTARIELQGVMRERLDAYERSASDGPSEKQQAPAAA